MDKEALAREIKVLRARKDFTQQDLALYSGVSECTIALIESKNYTTLPRINTLVKLAKALDVEEEILTRYLK